jgi:HNH endonuclease
MIHVDLDQSLVAHILWVDLNGKRTSDHALEAVRRFVALRGTSPTAASWTHSGMSPSEKTIRRRFGSFKAAVQCAGIDFVDPA